jgi:predicted ester cyclase
MWPSVQEYRLTAPPSRPPAKARTIDRRLAMTSNETTSVVEEFYEQWNSGAIDFERLVHAKIANHQPEQEAEVGSEAFRQAIEGVMEAVPDSRWTPLKVIASGDLVVCHIRWSGTWGGSIFRGVATPSGKRFSVEHIHIYRVEDQQLAEHWVVRDDLGMMLQLDALPV